LEDTKPINVDNRGFFERHAHIVLTKETKRLRELEIRVALEGKMMCIDELKQLQDYINRMVNNERTKIFEICRWKEIEVDSK